MATQLSEDLRTSYERDGFVIIRDGFTDAEIQELNDETTAICRGDRGMFWGLLPAQEGETDDEVLQRHLCVHYPHKCSEVMKESLSHPAIVDVLTQVIGPNVKCMQSMLFIKASGKPGQAWHQDEFYIPSRDRSLTASWIALDDATVENGCLWAIPGSHKSGIVWRQHEVNSPDFDCSGEAEFPYDDNDAVPIELERGSFIIFNGYLLHRSLPNRAPEGSYRRALTCHYLSAESLLPLYRPPKDQPTATWDFRDIVMVAGKDPYAWKGYADIAVPHVRPTGEGGCSAVYRNLIENQGVVPSDEQLALEGDD